MQTVIANSRFGALCLTNFWDSQGCRIRRRDAATVDAEKTEGSKQIKRELGDRFEDNVQLRR